jgi:hypothetical protein
MTLSISLSPEAQHRLSSRAKSEGVDLVTLAARLLEAEARRVTADEGSPTPNKATLDLLAQWDKEEETSDPDEIARGQRELEEFMEGMNRARLECEGPESRKIYP